MPFDDNLREYHAQFRRVVATKRACIASQFTVIVHAGDADDAHRKGKQHESLLRGTFTLAGVQLIEPSQASPDGNAAESGSN